MRIYELTKTHGSGDTQPDNFDQVVEAFVSYDTTRDHIKAASKVCQKVKDMARGKPIRIELRPEIVHGYCHGIVLTDLFAEKPGSGFGTPLMKYLLQLADEAGLNVYTDAEGPRSYDFYTKLGFSKDSTGRHQLVFYPDPGEEYAYLYEGENETYPSTLDEKGLIEFAWECIHEDEIDDVDESFIDEMFDGASAVLRRVPINGLTLNGGVEVKKKTKQYRKLTTEAPPIIVNSHTKEVMDGNHRLREALRRGQTDILAYWVSWIEDDPL